MALIQKLPKSRFYQKYANPKTAIQGIEKLSNSKLSISYKSRNPFNDEFLKGGIWIYPPWQLIDSFQSDEWCILLWIKSSREVVKARIFGSTSNKVKKKQDLKFFPWRSTYQPKIRKNSGNGPKKDGGGGKSRVYIFKNCQNLKCAQSSDYYLKFPGKVYLTLMRHTQVNFRKPYFAPKMKIMTNIDGEMLFSKIHLGVPHECQIHFSWKF